MRREAPRRRARRIIYQNLTFAVAVIVVLIGLVSLVQFGGDRVVRWLKSR